MTELFRVEISTRPVGERPSLASEFFQSRFVTVVTTDLPGLQGMLADARIGKIHVCKFRELTEHEYQQRREKIALRDVWYPTVTIRDLDAEDRHDRLMASQWNVAKHTLSVRNKARITLKQAAKHKRFAPV